MAPMLALVLVGGIRSGSLSQWLRFVKAGGTIPDKTSGVFETSKDRCSFNLRTRRNDICRPASIKRPGFMVALIPFPPCDHIVDSCRRVPVGLGDVPRSGAAESEDYESDASRFDQRVVSGSAPTGGGLSVPGGLDHCPGSPRGDEGLVTNHSS